MNACCPNCGGTLIGDGYTSVLHCENAEDLDAIAEAEADAGPIYCAKRVEPEPVCRNCIYWTPAPAVDRNAGLCRKERTYRGLCPAGHTCAKWAENKEVNP